MSKNFKISAKILLQIVVDIKFQPKSAKMEGVKISFKRLLFIIDKP
jgi:hypothetical protein